ncbi:hypothetical protein Vse01_02830 [Micromonospora sediminimaris]|uniref:Uncharacterized protein n=1 Tax=Micromonospora sediminimaris TaxID=547162 RepID=A0A9W5UMC6_9ACTN|nr:hypothetical protein Vse01_02830 [Micromonospora sediminimaris]
MGGVATPGGTINPGVASASPPTTRCSGTGGGGVGFGDRTTFGATAFGQGTAFGAAGPGAGGGVTAAAGGADEVNGPEPTVIAATPGVAGIVPAARAAKPAARARILMNTQTNGRISGDAHPARPVRDWRRAAIFAGRC